MENILLDILLDILWRTSKIYLGVIFGYLMILSPLKKYRDQFIKFTMNVLTPILIFISILQVEGSRDAIYPIIASVLVSIGGIIFLKILTITRSNPKPSEICTAAFPNALNFPFPLIFALSPASLGAAGIFLVVQIILRNSLGLWISGVKLGRENIIELIKFPPIWAVFFGVLGRIMFSASFRSELSTSNNDFIFFTVELGIFATLMTLGFSIQKPNSEHLHTYFRVGISRYILAPFSLLIIFLPFKIPTTIMLAMIVQTMAPPAVYNGIYAERFGLDTNLTSNTTLVLTIIALLFVPVEFYFLELYFL